jgi:hypothetical protein
MTDQSKPFYVAVKDSKGVTQFVAAKFLTVDGRRVYDPNANAAGVPDKINPTKIPLYSGKSLSSPVINNSGGFLIVPWDFQISSVVKYSKGLDSLITRYDGARGVELR